MSLFNSNDGVKIKKLETSLADIATNGINPKQYGCVMDGITDDTTNFFTLLNYIKQKSNGKIIPIKLPANAKLKLSQPIVLFDGLKIFCNVRNAEFSNQASIINTTTDMFSLNSNVLDIAFQGICFEGNPSVTTNMFTPVDHATGYIIKYSLIEKCGIKYFINMIDGRILGTHIRQNFINNGKYAFNLSGSDNVVCDNFIDTNETLAASYSGIVSLTTFGTSRFERNFITSSIPSGRAGIPLYMYGNCGGTVISSNWFDYSDYSAVYLVSVTGPLNFDNNFTRQNARVIFQQYNAIFVLFDCSNIAFNKTQFLNQTTTGYAFAFRKSTSGTNNISIRDNVTDGLYTPTYYQPSTECSNIFIDDPIRKLLINVKNYVNMTMAFGAFATVNAQSSRSYDTTVPDTIPINSTSKLIFSTSTPLEDGIIAEVIPKGTSTVTLRFTNVKSTNVNLADKTFSLVFMWQ